MTKKFKLDGNDLTHSVDDLEDLLNRHATQPFRKPVLGGSE